MTNIEFNYYSIAVVINKNEYFNICILFFYIFTRLAKEFCG